MTFDEAVKFLRSVHYRVMEVSGEEKWFITVGDDQYFGPFDAETFIAKVEELKANVETIGIDEWNLCQTKYVTPWPLPAAKSSQSNV